jgi:glycine hydroxymethyltransferase
MSDFINNLIALEEARQNETLNLIASENYSSKDVRAAAASVFTDKYAEGYPGKRYYSGCEHVDTLELYAIDCAKKIFGAEHANVQPHSGSNANLAVYMSCIRPGDTVLGMALSAGGHLTHGHKMNISGKIFNFVPYGVNKETEMLDYEEIEKLAEEHKPKLFVVGASAYSRFIDYERCAKISEKFGMLLLVDMAHVAGLVAAKLHPNPTPYADFVTSTTHKTLRGPRGGIILCKEKHASKIDKAVMPGTQGGPLMHLIAAKAVAFEEAAFPEFIDYQKLVLSNAKLLSEEFAKRGYRIVSEKTGNHLFLIDLTGKKDGFGQELTGKLAEEKLNACNIALNRNTVPFDSRGPLVTSGVRIGTPAISTRGFGPKEVARLAGFICEIWSAGPGQDELVENIKKEVKEICLKFPAVR